MKCVNARFKYGVSEPYIQLIKNCLILVLVAYSIQCEKNEPVEQSFETEYKVDAFYLMSSNVQDHEQKSIGESPLNDDSAILIDEIWRYLQLGDDEIVISNQTDVNLVIGLSGVGRTTLTQFVANNDNRLHAAKDKEGSFYITDNDGVINDTSTILSISLPHLVVEKETHTAFYDCPGFLDSKRNKTMDIANAFFLKKVATHAKRIKIIIVVSYATMQFSARHTLLDLFEQITFFVKDMKKFSHGINLITTKMNKGFNDKRTLEQYKEYLETILEEIDGSWAPRANLESAKDIIRILLITDSSGLLNKVGIFRTPTVAGYLDEMSSFTNMKDSFKNLIWNSTSYIPCTENDFGINFNDKAAVLINNHIMAIDKSIENLLRQLGNTILTRFFYTFENLRNEMFDGLFDFQSNLTGLMNAKYPLIENPVGHDVKDYITEIKGTLSRFVTNSEMHFFTNLSKYGEQLILLQKIDIRNTVIIRPQMWIAPLVRLPSGLLNYVQGDVSSNIYRLIFESFNDFNLDVQSEIFLQISFEDLDETAKQYKTLKSQLNEITANVKSYFTNSDKALSDFLNFVLKEMKVLAIPSFQHISNSLELHINLSRVLDTFPSLKWKLEQDWDTPIYNINAAILLGWVNFQHLLESNIEESLSDVSIQIKQMLLQDIDVVVNGNLENLQTLLFNLNGLSQTNYPLSENIRGLDASKYIEEIIYNVIKFEFPSFKLSDMSEKLAELDRLALLLDDLINTDQQNSIIITPERWVESLVAINSSVLTHIKGPRATRLLDETYTEFVEFNIELQNQLSDQLPKNDVHLRGRKLKTLMLNLQQIYSNMALQMEITTLRLSDFLSFMLHQYDSLNIVMPPEKLQNMIQKIAVAKIFDHFGSINWKKDMEWTKPFIGVHTFSLNMWNHFLVNIESSIISITTNIGTTSFFQITQLFDDVMNDSYDNIPYLNYNLEALSKTSYPLSMNIPNLLLDASVYMQEIIQNLQKFNLTISCDEITQLKSLASLLETLHNSQVENSTEINPIEWATPLADMNESVLSYVETYISTPVLSETFSSFVDYIKDLNGEMYKILATDELAARGRRMKIFKSQWGSIKLNMETKLSEANLNLHEFLESMKIEFDVLQVAPSNAAKNSLLLHIQISSVLSTFDRILWQNKYNWENVFFIRYQEVVAEWLSILNCIEPRIIDITLSMANHVSLSFQNEMVDVKDGRHNNHILLKQSINQLKSTSYPLSLNSAGLKAYVYVNEIFQNIRKFGNNLNLTLLVELTELGALIDSVHESEDESLLVVNPRKWVADLRNVFSRLTTYVQANISSSLFLTIFTNLSNFVEETYVSLLYQGHAIDINDQVELLTPLAQKFAIINENMNRQYQNVNPTLYGFLSLAVSEMKNLNVPISNSHLQNMQISVDIGNVHDSFDTIRWKPAQNWMNPINDAHDRVYRQMTWIQFLSQLFKDLITSSIQVYKQHALQDWWRGNSQVSNNNFDNFWARFSPANALQNAQKEIIRDAITVSTGNLASLNNLLALTLSEVTTCTTYTQTTVYKANFLQLSNAIRCYQQFRTTNFVIIALHSFFIDVNIVSSQIPAAQSVFIVAPNWLNTGGQKLFNLRGVDGTNGFSMGSSGTNGGNGKNIIGVYSSSNGGIDFATDGGSGGNGREGYTGSAGQNGASQVFLAKHDPHCSAWSGGEIRVKLYPNNCNSPGGKCHAPDGGRWVYIDGKPGTPGGRGGNGGNGGSAGRVGYAITLDVSLNIKYEKYSNNGQPGRGGAGGLGGLGGLSGSTTGAIIDDAASGSGKYCSVNGAYGVASTTRAGNGVSGTYGYNGSSYSINNQTIILSVSDIQPHIAVYKAEADKIKSNQFFHKFVTGFISKLNTNTVIPN